MSGDDGEHDAGPFAAALSPHLAQLHHAAQVRAEQQRAIDEAPPPPRCLDEAQLMALIFRHLDPDNLRVCEGIDFDRLRIVAPTESELARTRASAGGEEREPPEPDGPGPSSPTQAGESRGLAQAATAAKDWVGASWSDELGPIVELVDRPELSAAQAELLRRASKTRLAELNLRHLGREAALRHLELFVRVCEIEGSTLCRVITGKGVFSASDPVLKRVVLEWCVARPPRRSGGERVLAWAPEPDQHGEWGALILHLRRPRRSA